MIQLYIHIYLFFQILFLYSLLQNMVNSSLCYTVGPCWLSILYIIVCMLCYAKSLQLCPTLCDPIDGSPPESPVPGILQARTLEWVAISFSNA